MTDRDLLWNLQDHILTLTLNRPHRMNGLNPAAYAALEQAFRRAEGDRDVRVIILTGADPAFCAGEDVKEMMTGEVNTDSLDRLTATTPKMTPAAEAILACNKPIIAAVNGAAVGWGMDLALMADFRIASEKAKFGELFVKRGLIADVGGLMRLPRIVGPEKAAELLYTGEIIDAAEAARIGLVRSTVPHEALLSDAQALAAKISENPPLAVQQLKAGLRKSFWGEPAEMGAWISHVLGLLFQTEDHREGVKAFLEKRPAAYQGR